MDRLTHSLQCDVNNGPVECVDPPGYSEYGYTSRQWDGTKVTSITIVAVNPYYMLCTLPRSC